MDSKPKRIKIKLDLPEKAATYFKRQKIWESEGGAPHDAEKLPDVDLPFEKGDVVKILSGVVDVKDGEVVYVADVQIVSQK